MRTALEREFLPEALELIETPAPALPRAVLWVIVAALGFAILWACVGQIDLIAVAPRRTQLGEGDRREAGADAADRRATRRGLQAPLRPEIRFRARLPPARAGEDRERARPRVPEGARAAARRRDRGSAPQARQPGR